MEFRGVRNAVHYQSFRVANELKKAYENLQKSAENYLKSCEEAKESNCYEKVRKAVETHCEAYNDSPLCDWISTTTAVKMHPFISGGVAGVIVLLAIGIALYCYCRKKKKMGGQKKTQGLNTSGTTVNSGTANGTGAATGMTYNNPVPLNTQERY